MSDPPLVGVTGPARRGHTAWRFASLALRRAGARTRRLQPPYEEQLVRDLAAVVIGGGENLDPRRYREEPIVEHTYDPERDELEWRVLDRAMERVVPVLGICRGAQLINVYCGGSLYQDIARDFGLRIRRSHLALRPVRVEEPSLLAEVMGVSRLNVNSLHRQGIKRLGEGLEVAARDGNGLVQAIEARRGSGRFLLGVQWHPEYLPTRRPHQRLFVALVQAGALHHAESLV